MCNDVAKIILPFHLNMEKIRTNKNVVLILEYAMFFSTFLICEECHLVHMVYVMELSH